MSRQSVKETLLAAFAAVAKAAPLLMQHKLPVGIYHLTAGGHTSWHGYAVHVIEQARARGLPIRVAPTAIAAVPTSAFPTPARRPGNSRLDTRKLQHSFGLRLPAWRRGRSRSR